MKPIIMGAMLGAASSAVMGKDPLKGAILGGVGGGVSSAFTGGAGAAGLEAPMSFSPVDAMAIDPSNLMTQGLDPSIGVNLSDVATNALPETTSGLGNLYSVADTPFTTNQMGIGANLNYYNPADVINPADLVADEGILSNAMQNMPQENKNIFGMGMGDVATDIAETPGLLQRGENYLQEFGEKNPGFIAQQTINAAQPDPQEEIPIPSVPPMKQATIDVDDYKSFGVTPTKKKRMYNIPLNYTA